VNHPDHWTEAELQDLGEWKTGSTPRRSRDDYWGGDILWVSPKDMKTNRIAETEDRMTQKALDETNSKLIPPDSIIIVTRSGILEHTLPVAINDKPVTINQDLKALIPANSVNVEYLFYYLKSNEINILKNCTKDGTTVASINSDSLYSYEIPIAPLAEQEQIVKKIGELLSKLDAGVSDLETAGNKLHLYKRVQLNRALEGRLTNNIEEEIRHPALNIVDESNLPETAPELPRYWIWVRFESMLTEPLRNGKSAKKAESGIRTLTLTAVTERDFSEENSKITEADPEQVEDLWLQSGDLLIERSNTEEYVGLPAVYRGEDGYAIYPDLMIRARCDESIVSPEFADYMLLSPYFRNYLRGKSKGTSGSMAKINQKHLREMPFPLPPLDEQQVIVERLDQITSVVDQTIQDLEDEVERSGRLRQSIFDRAFDGELINFDEPNTSRRESQKKVESNTDSAEQVTLTEVSGDVE